MSELTHSCWCPPSGRPYQFVSDMSTLSRWPGQGQSPHQTERQQILNIFHLFVCHHWLTANTASDPAGLWERDDRTNWNILFVDTISSRPASVSGDSQRDGSKKIKTVITDQTRRSNAAPSFNSNSRFFVTGNYSWKCEPVDYSQDPEALRALDLAWIFYFSKIIDMIDSVIFLLKKKSSHLSFLHIFHHGIMPFYCWWGPRFVGGGQSGFGAFLNAGVHTVMYLYYFLASFGPEIQKYLWWKK